jgi:hypothetical protein
MSHVVTSELSANEPAPAPLKKRRAAASSDPYALIRRLIWLYLILWLIEGGLRRWFLPGLATPLLLIRDPLVVLIYFLAVSKRLFPLNGFIIVGAILGVLTFASALVLGHGNPLVAAYGVRCNFLHVPLIFIIGRVLRREDLLRLCKVAVWLVVPYTALLVAQFYAPQTAWVNRGVGDSSEGAGFSGALDHFRPPGTFSFITGPATLYPLFTAAWFVLALARKLPWWMMLASGTAIVVAIPISISRLLFLSVLIVAVAGCVAMVVGGRVSVSMMLRALLAAILIPILASQFGAFKDGMEAFGSRWENATVEGGGFQATIVDRVIEELFGSFDDVSLIGLGTGYSTNVGQKLLVGKEGLGAAESTWGRMLFDNGLVLGSFMILYRVALAGMLFLPTLRAWRKKSSDGLIFLSASFLLVMNTQWGQASLQGAATIAAGLTLAAAGETKLKKRKVESRNQKPEIRNRRSEDDSNEAPFAVTAQPQITDPKSEAGQ